MKPISNDAREPGSLHRIVRRRSDNPEDIANMLRMVNGKLVLRDGGNVKAYLLDWADEAKVDADTPVVVMRRDGMVKLAWHAWMAKHWAS